MQKRSVLIVEDEVLVGMMLARKIEAHGYAICDVVGTGEEAIARFISHQPGAILMDVSLGGKMDGIEAGEEIRGLSDVPIIFFTGYHQDRALLRRAEKIRPVAILDKLGAIDAMISSLEEAFTL